MRKLVLVSLSAFFLGACSTYPLKVQKSLREMERGNFQVASSLLKEHAFSPGGDQVAYLLDYALMQQYAGNFQESNKAFELADRLTEVKDYISLSDEAASLVFSESMVAYKGDDYEKLLINVFSALNYSSLGKYESALVEVRRMNEKLNLYRDQAGRDYQENPFVYYLSALLWEKQKSWDSACIDYEKVYELRPGFPGIGQDLVFCSYVSRRMQKHRAWKDEFGIEVYGRKQANERINRKEIFVVHFEGFGPKKSPNPAWHRIPILIPDRTSYFRKSIMLSQAGRTETSNPIVSLESLAIDSLNKQYGKLIAKRIAARIAKEQIAQRLEKEDQGAALIARIVMDVTDQADLRQWSALPRSLQILRFPVDEKAGPVKLSVLGGSGLPDQVVELSPTDSSLEVVLIKDRFIVRPAMDLKPEEASPTSPKSNM